LANPGRHCHTFPRRGMRLCELGSPPYLPSLFRGALARNSRNKHAVRVGSCGIGIRLDGPITIFLFTAFFVTPIVFNALFHLAASFIPRSYFAGATSALNTRLAG